MMLRYASLRARIWPRDCGSGRAETYEGREVNDGC